MSSRDAARPPAVGSVPRPRRGFAPAVPTVSIIGAGRAGTALAVALAAAGYRIVAVQSRSEASAARLGRLCGAPAVPTAVAAVARADLCLLTVPDRAITGVAATVAATGMALRGHALVHCSGARPAAALAAARQGGAAIGCCHPLMALVSGAGPRELRGAYFGIEADATLRPTLTRLVEDLGGVAFDVPAGDRALYHAAAVLAGNAPLALLARAAELLESAGVDPSVAGAALAGLLEGAARNARRLGARTALTGPVVRGDGATVAAHIAALGGAPAAQRLYVGLAAETLRVAGGAGREAVAEVLAGPPPRPRPPHAVAPVRRSRVVPGGPRRAGASTGAARVRG